MTSDVSSLVEELRSAFRGLGLRDHSWRQRVEQAGNQLPRLAGIDDLDPDPVATKKLNEWMRYAVCDYPDEDQKLLCVLAGMHPTIRHDTLEAREDCLAGELEVSRRTVQRRLKDALERLARDGLANRGRAVVADRRGYVVTKLDASLRLDLDPPIVTERVLLDVTAEQLDTIVRPVSVPHDARAEGRFRCEVLEGGRLRKTEQQPGELDLLLLHIEPPHTLQRGDTHRVRIRYTFDPKAFFVVDPHTPYDVVRLEVRFHPDRQPIHVWRLDRATRWATGELLPPHPSGRYEAVTFGLHPGFVSGLRWGQDGPATE